MPVYLRADTELALMGLSLGLGVGERAGQPLQFARGEAPLPTLVDSGVPGTLALAWLDGLDVAAGERALLGYVEMLGSEAMGRSLEFYGAVANAREDGRSVLLGSAAGARQ